MRDNPEEVLETTYIAGSTSSGLSGMLCDNSGTSSCIGTVFIMDIMIP